MILVYVTGTLCLQQQPICLGRRSLHEATFYANHSTMIRRSYILVSSGLLVSPVPWLLTFDHFLFFSPSHCFFGTEAGFALSGLGVHVYTLRLLFAFLVFIVLRRSSCVWLEAGGSQGCVCVCVHVIPVISAVCLRTGESTHTHRHGKIWSQKQNGKKKTS